MRRIAYAAMGTLSALVALFSYHTSTNSQISTASAGHPADTSGTAAGGSSAPAASSGGSPSGSSDSSSSSSSSGTYTGDVANTQWGVVQVQITVVKGKITKSEAVQYPTQNPRDQEINAYAVPQLNSEVVQGQNGNIDAVSGATVTSDGYIQSLQSAIDQAHL